MKKKDLIVSLIKDDLINSKLVNGLTELGIDAGNYHVHLGDTVFRLMGLKESQKSDQVYERYLELTKCARSIDIAEPGKCLDKLAAEIYEELRGRVK